MVDSSVLKSTDGVAEEIKEKDLFEIDLIIAEHVNEVRTSNATDDDYEHIRKHYRTDRGKDGVVKYWPRFSEETSKMSEVLDTLVDMSSRILFRRLLIDVFPSHREFNFDAVSTEDVARAYAAYITIINKQG